MIDKLEIFPYRRTTIPLLCAHGHYKVGVVDHIMAEHIDTTYRWHRRVTTHFGRLADSKECLLPDLSDSRGNSQRSQTIAILSLECEFVNLFESFVKQKKSEIITC